MRVTEFHRLERDEYHRMLRSVKKWIGIRGIKLLQRYLDISNELDREVILSKTSILLCRYSMVMTFRLMMLDIKYYFNHQKTEFIITEAEEHYIERQLQRFIQVGTYKGVSNERECTDGDGYRPKVQNPCRESMQRERAH